MSDPDPRSRALCELLSDLDDQAALDFLLEMAVYRIVSLPLKTGDNLATELVKAQDKMVDYATDFERQVTRDLARANRQSFTLIDGGKK